MSIEPKRRRVEPGRPEPIDPRAWFNRYLWPLHPTGSQEAAWGDWWRIMGWSPTWQEKNAQARRIQSELRRAVENWQGIDRQILPDLSRWLREKRWSAVVNTCPRFVEVWCEAMRLQDVGTLTTDEQVADFFDGFGADPDIGQRCREHAAFLRLDGLTHDTRRGPQAGPLAPVIHEAVERAREVGQW